MSDDDIKRVVTENLKSSGQSQAAIRNLLRPHFAQDSFEDDEFEAVVDDDEIDNRFSQNRNAASSFKKAKKQQVKELEFDEEAIGESLHSFHPGLTDEAYLTAFK